MLASQADLDSTMTGADLAILVVLAISALVGLFRGFIKEVFSLATWACALVLSFLFRTPVGQALPLDPELNPVILDLAGGACIFIVVLILGGLLAHLLSKLAKATGLSGTDRTLGAVFGLVRGLIVVLVILIFLPAIDPVQDASWWEESLFIPHFLEFEGWAKEVLSSLTSWTTDLVTETDLTTDSESSETE
jgi:membrane protein required for colicin V production